MRHFTSGQPYVAAKSFSCFWSFLFLWLSPRPIGHRLYRLRPRGSYLVRLTSRSGFCSVIPYCRNVQYLRSKTFCLLSDLHFRCPTPPIGLNPLSDILQNSLHAHYVTVARYSILVLGNFAMSSSVIESYCLSLASFQVSSNHIDPDFLPGTSTCWTQPQKVHWIIGCSCYRYHTFTYLGQRKHTSFPYPYGLHH